jgi:sugar phosphate isomerase/epimerase
MHTKLKIAYMVSTPDLRIDESVTALQGDLKKCFCMLRDRGYDGVEIMAGDPDKWDLASLHQHARNAGLEVPVICTGEMFAQYGLSFMDPDESARNTALDKAITILDRASELGAAVNVGRLRGSLTPAVPRETALGWMYNAFDRLAKRAEELGIRILLEPVAYPFCNVINTTLQGIEAVRTVGSEAFRLMLDVFSMNMEDPSIEEAFAKAFPYLNHVHLCDANRLAPGMGKFDFTYLLGGLKRSGYRGYVSVECFQVPDQETALEQSTNVLMPLVEGWAWNVDQKYDEER